METNVTGSKVQHCQRSRYVAVALLASATMKNDTRVTTLYRTQHGDPSRGLREVADVSDTDETVAPYYYSS